MLRRAPEIPKVGKTQKGEKMLPFLKLYNKQQSWKGRRDRREIARIRERKSERVRERKRERETVHYITIYNAKALPYKKRSSDSYIVAITCSEVRQAQDIRYFRGMDFMTSQRARTKRQGSKKPVGVRVNMLYSFSFSTESLLASMIQHAIQWVTGLRSLSIGGMAGPWRCLQIKQE